MSAIPLLSPQKLLILLLLGLFPFAGFSNEKFSISTCAGDSLKSSVLKSDSLAESLIVLKATYNKIPSEGEDPLLHLEYTNYPVCQVRPLDFAALIANTDTVELTGVFLEVHIVGDQYSYSETFNSESIVMAAGDTTLLVIPDYLPPNLENNYEIQYNIHWDQQDSIQLVSTSRSFGVNEYGSHIFSRDNGEMIATTNDLGTGETFMAGLIYSFTGFNQICCLGVKFGPSDDTNTYAVLELRDVWYFSGIPSFGYLLETAAFYSGFNPFDGNSFHWVPLEFPFVLDPEGLNSEIKFLVNVKVFNPSESMASIGISSHDAPDSSAYIFGIFGDTDCTAGCPTNDLYMIRVGMSNAFCTTSIAEVAENISDFFCAPNPVSGPFTVHYTLSEQADIQFYLFDNMGRVVARQNPGTQLSGKHTLFADAPGLAAGVYTATLVADGKAASKQVVIR